MADTSKTPNAPAPAGNKAPAAASTSQPATTGTVEKKSTRVSTVPKDETKEAKIKRLGTARVNKAVKVILQIGNLATYKPTSEQVDKIVGVLTQTVNDVAGRLRGVSKKEESFSL